MTGSVPVGDVSPLVVALAAPVGVHGRLLLGDLDGLDLARLSVVLVAMMGASGGRVMTVVAIVVPVCVASAVLEVSVVLAALVVLVVDVVLAVAVLVPGMLAVAVMAMSVPRVAMVPAMPVVGVTVMRPRDRHPVTAVAVVPVGRLAVDHVDGVRRPEQQQ